MRRVRVVLFSFFDGCLPRRSMVTDVVSAVMALPAEENAAEIKPIAIKVTKDNYPDTARLSRSSSQCLALLEQMQDLNITITTFT